MSNRRYKKKKQVDSLSPFRLIEKGIARLIELIFPRGGFAVYPHGEISRIWNDIEQMEPKLAIIEADKLVDSVLRRAKIRGETFADRLRKVEKLVPYSSYQQMWEAHKVRNELVHEVGHDAHISNPDEVLRKIKNFLIALGAFKNG